uniref:Putative 8.9 kDa secreted protein n=1 Tax=Ixodes ricinus TaxID=34613 RepID=A0A090XD71_IXORI
MLFPAALVLVLAASSSVWKISQAEPPFSDVVIVDGKCTYENHTVADGESLAWADPCQLWECNVEERSFGVLPCGLVAIPAGCEMVRGTGPYPDCCYRAVCP